MSKSRFILTGIVTISILFMISINLSNLSPILSLKMEVQYKTPSSQDVNCLLNEFRLSPNLEEESQYLIYFDETSDFNDFLMKYSVKMVFRGLEGVIIQTTPSMISNLVKDISYLTDNDVHRISNTPRRLATRAGTISSTAPTQSIQTISSAQIIGVDKLWDLGYTGKGITIGIFDEGINQSHPDYSFPNGTSRIKYVEGFVNTTYGNSEDFEPTGGHHGTLVAGYAAGGGIQTPDYKGMAPEAWLLDADLDESGGSELDMTTLGEIAAINWAIESGVDIINRSYGPDDPEEAYWTQRLHPLEQIVLATIRQGIKKGVIFVHSAGNNGGTSINGYRIDSQNYVEEITVGATNEGGGYKADYSSTGPVWGTNAISPDVVAPGTNIPTTSVNGGYEVNVQGTSFSAPHVAGASAVLLEAMRDNGIHVNPGSIKAALMATTNNPWEELFLFGAGQINASSAYDYLINAPKVDNHAIVAATNPINMTSWVPGNRPIQQALVGSEISVHFSFVSSESKNVSVSVGGNISSLIAIEEMYLANFSSGLRYNSVALEDGKLSDQYSHNIILKILIPEETLSGYYNGNLTFRVNNTIIKEIPYAFNVENSNKRILFHTGTSADFTYNTIFGEFVELQYRLSEQGIVLNEYNGYITPQILMDYDLLWMAACNQTSSEFTYDPQTEEVLDVNRDIIINETEHNTINQFVENGGGLILTPYSNPNGIETLVNGWGITTKEVNTVGIVGDGTFSHFGPIGSTIDGSFDFAGVIFSAKPPAIPIAYQNVYENVVMASYDDPNGGRVVVASGSDFIVNTGFESENNFLVSMDIIDWLDYDHQLFGMYETTDNVVSISLHTSTNYAPVNTGDIIGLYKDLSNGIITNITEEIPTTGTNGWYNFTYTIESESIVLFNFSWKSDFVGFEYNIDNTPPFGGVSGLENNSRLFEITEVIFWFDDLGSGANKFNAEMSMDGTPVGYGTPKLNSTGSG
ncbi:MAG: S8 family peptidase, partial [Candidatus Hodarchaeales archaeon]